MEKFAAADNSQTWTSLLAAEENTLLTKSKASEEQKINTWPKNEKEYNRGDPHIEFCWIFYE